MKCIYCRLAWRLAQPCIFTTHIGNVLLNNNQGLRNDVKARGADFHEKPLLNCRYILRDVCKTSGVELRLIMFSIYWMIGV